ncbi:MAG: transglutaminase domain-containing protein [Chloroflexi bacterium]|nr:transglutaminase domain-containing protein [Chloroflexota bacterium]
MHDPLLYYTRPGLMTDPGEHAPLLHGLPADIPALVKVVQGNLLHIFWAERYGVKLTPERQQEVNLRRISTMLAWIHSVDDRPLTVPRPVEQRLVGNCRDFSLMLCTLLRQVGIPARPRCGFGAYFEAGQYIDHWTCEYWNAAQNRWIQVDAQMDDLQREVLKLSFDPLDVPYDQFLSGGRAWLACRSGQADADKFGIFDMHGLWFIRGNVGRDLASLNRMELLPWDCWGIMDQPAADTEEGLALYDRISALTLADNDSFDAMRALYEDDRLCVPDMIRSYENGQVREMNIQAPEPLPAGKTLV